MSSPTLRQAQGERKDVNRATLLLKEVFQGSDEVAGVVLKHHVSGPRHLNQAAMGQFTLHALGDIQRQQVRIRAAHH